MSVLRDDLEWTERTSGTVDANTDSDQSDRPVAEPPEEIHEVQHFRADITIPSQSGTLELLVTRHEETAHGVAVRLVSENSPLSVLPTWGVILPPEGEPQVVPRRSLMQRSDQQGRVRFEHLLPGRYRVEAESGITDAQLERFAQRARHPSFPANSDSEWSKHGGIGVAAGEVRRLNVRLNSIPAPLPIRVHDAAGDRLMSKGNVALGALLTPQRYTGTQVSAEALQLAPRHPGLWYLTVQSRRSGVSIQDNRY